MLGRKEVQVLFEISVRLQGKVSQRFGLIATYMWVTFQSVTCFELIPGRL